MLPDRWVSSLALFRLLVNIASFHFFRRGLQRAILCCSSSKYLDLKIYVGFWICVVQCADPSWFLCTDYQPNIPGYVPNDPGYWCCPTGTQCLVSPEAGFVCSAANNGDTPGSTVLSGQAPTQASTATTAPTLAGSATAGTTSAPLSSIPFWKMIDWTSSQKIRIPQHQAPQHRAPQHLRAPHHLLLRVMPQRPTGV